MSRTRLYAGVGGVLVLAAALAVALLFGVFTGGREGQLAAEKPLAAPVQQAPALPQAVPVVASVVGEVQEAVPEAQRGGPGEGIQVHGHWTIEVREPDGSVARRSEFQNALHSGGRQILASLLGRGGSIGLWRLIVIGNASANFPCQQPVGTPNSCIIAEPLDNTSGNNVFKVAPNNLMVMPGSPDASKTHLSGSFIVQRDGNISRVETFQPLVCLPTVAPASCGPGGSGVLSITFTLTDLASPVPVVTGQQVLVSVTFSFS
jgi:hypothetical protein